MGGQKNTLFVNAKLSSNSILILKLAGKVFGTSKKDIILKNFKKIVLKNTF